MSLITITTISGKLRGHDVGATISGNGNYVFYTTGWDVGRDDPRFYDEDLFRVDLQTGATIQVSHKTSQYGASWYPEVSDDGQQAAYTLLEGDRVDTAVTNISNGVRTTVSLNPAGRPDNGVNTHVALSGDGRYVAFASDATDLTGTPDRNGVQDIFVRNLQTGGLVNASTNSNGTQLTASSNSPELSADGHLVVFNNGSQIYAKNLLNGALTLVTTNSAGQQGNGYLSGSGDNGRHNLAVSDDGRYVVYASSASNLVSNDTNGLVDVFRKDLQTGQVVRASVNSSGQQYGDIQSVGDVAISADGRYVAFTASIASAGGPGLYLKDLNSGAIMQVAANTINAFALSSDGHKLSYLGTTADTHESRILLATVSSDFGKPSLTSTAGNDTLTGGAGLDTAIYHGNRSNYTITVKDNGVVTVADKAGVDGTDTLTGIERLHFSDVEVALDISGVAGQAYRIYQAAFNRAPDQAGLGYWIKQMDNGASLEQVAKGFLQSQEAQKLYGAAPGSAALVDSLYHNVLHRAGDDKGFAYWKDILDHNPGSQSQVLASFAESAENQAALVGVMTNGVSYTPYTA
jgi:hypothetical protein